MQCYGKVDNLSNIRYTYNLMIVMKMIVEKGSADVTNRSMRSQLIVTYHG